MKKAANKDGGNWLSVDKDKEQNGFLDCPMGGRQRKC